MELDVQRVTRGCKFESQAGITTQVLQHWGTSVCSVKDSQRIPATRVVSLQVEVGDHKRDGLKSKSNFIHHSRGNAQCLTELDLKIRCASNRMRFPTVTGLHSLKGALLTFKVKFKL